MEPRQLNLKDRITNGVATGLIGLSRALPYETRVRFMGWAMSRVIAPLAGYRARIRENLARACPELSPKDVAVLVRAVPDNMGRTLAEIYSGPQFVERMKNLPLAGPGMDALNAARDEGRPAVIVTGHFGNYDAPRAALIAHGYKLAALYRPMNNAAFNEHYVAAMNEIGPVYPRGRQGLTRLIRHLRDGGIAEFLVDQYMYNGADLTFFGHTARTALSAAELALKYDAVLVPMYGVRQANGLDFDLVFEAPIPPSNPETMTQALNDSLEAITRKHMDQWMWSHRRWKTRAEKNKKKK